MTEEAEREMFSLVIWTDFGVPSEKFFDTREAARAYGEYSIRELGCARYTISSERWSDRDDDEKQASSLETSSDARQGLASPQGQQWLLDCVPINEYGRAGFTQSEELRC